MSYGIEDVNNTSSTYLKTNDIWLLPENLIYNCLSAGSF